MIKLLKIQRRHLQLKGGIQANLKAIALKAYIKDLCKCTEENWKDKYREIAQGANRNPIFNKDSTTLALINHIKDENQTAIQDIQLQRSAVFNGFVVLEKSETPLQLLQDKAAEIDLVLQHEMSRLQASRFAQAEPLQKEIILKGKKRMALHDIMNATTLEEAVELAQRYTADPDVTRGRSSRTSEFLRDCLDEHQRGAGAGMGK